MLKRVVKKEAKALPKRRRSATRRLKWRDFLTLNLIPKLKITLSWDYLGIGKMVIEFIIKLSTLLSLWLNNLLLLVSSILQEKSRNILLVILTCKELTQLKWELRNRWLSKTSMISEGQLRFTDRHVNMPKRSSGLVWKLWIFVMRSKLLMKDLLKPMAYRLVKLSLLELVWTMSLLTGPQTSVMRLYYSTTILWKSILELTFVGSWQIVPSLLLSTLSTMNYLRQSRQQPKQVLELLELMLDLEKLELKSKRPWSLMKWLLKARPTLSSLAEIYQAILWSPTLSTLERVCIL